MSTRMGGTGNAAPKEFELCPPGPQQLVCCDVINHGVVTTPGFGAGAPAKDVHKITIRWQSAKKMDDGKPYIVQRRYTLSSHRKAALRQALEAWRGKAFSDQEAAEFDVDHLIGVNCFANIVHERKPRGTFAEVVSIMPPLAQLPKLKIDPTYQRVIDPNAEATRHLWDPAMREPGDEDPGDTGGAPPSDTGERTPF